MIPVCKMKLEMCKRAAEWVKRVARISFAHHPDLS